MSAPAESRRGAVASNQPTRKKSEASATRGTEKVSLDGQEELRQAVSAALPERL